MRLFYYLSIVGRKDSLREFDGKLLITWELVRQVCEPCVLCTDALSNLYSFLERVVGDVLAVFDAVYNEMLQPFQLGELLFRDMVHVSAIGYVSKAVAENRKLVMHASYRDYAGSFYWIIFSGG